MYSFFDNNIGEPKLQLQINLAIVNTVRQKKNPYLAGNGKCIAFQGGMTTFLTTISLSQNTVTTRF